VGICKEKLSNFLSYIMPRSSPFKGFLPHEEESGFYRLNGSGLVEMCASVL
jgi:hypothetical protein